MAPSMLGGPSLSNRRAQRSGPLSHLARTQPIGMTTSNGQWTDLRRSDQTDGPSRPETWTCVQPHRYSLTSTCQLSISECNGEAVGVMLSWLSYKFYHLVWSTERVAKSTDNVTECNVRWVFAEPEKVDSVQCKFVNFVLVSKVFNFQQD